MNSFENFQITLIALFAGLYFITFLCLRILGKIRKDQMFYHGDLALSAMRKEELKTLIQSSDVKDSVKKKAEEILENKYRTL